MGFNYFYGNEAEKFMFYRVPKLLFELEGLKEMSVDAKILYGMLLDRVFLSIENGWIDENGRVYIIYTVKNAMGSLGCSEKKAIKILSELERKGLIEKKRRGFGKPNLIYVKNFLTKQSEWRLQNGKYDSQRTVDNTVHDLSGLQSNDTKENNTERKNTDSEQSFKYGQEGMCDERADYMELIKDDIGFDELIWEHPDMEDLIKTVLSVIVDIMCKKEGLVWLGKEEKPVAVVKGMYSKIRKRHVNYVLEECKKQRSINDVRQYLTAALYYAPVNILKIENM